MVSAPCGIGCWISRAAWPWPRCVAAGGCHHRMIIRGESGQIQRKIWVAERLGPAAARTPSMARLAAADRAAPGWRPWQAGRCQTQPPAPGDHSDARSPRWRLFHWYGLAWQDLDQGGPIRALGASAGGDGAERPPDPVRAAPGPGRGSRVLRPLIVGRPCGLTPRGLRPCPAPATGDWRPGRGLAVSGAGQAPAGPQDGPAPPGFGCLKAPIPRGSHTPRHPQGSPRNRGGLPQRPVPSTPDPPCEATQRCPISAYC